MKFTAAAIQMNSGGDKADNLQTSVRLIETAAASGATLIALPEEFNFLGRSEDHRANAEPIPGPTTELLSEAAQRLGVYILGGSILESVSGISKLYNTSVLLAPSGDVVARYRKIHLFDVQIPGRVESLESATMGAGDEVVVAMTDIGSLGISICYDIRFPELYRRLASSGAEVILIPAAFYAYTGKHHWELLVRARAVENGAFVIAPAQYGTSPEFESFGSTMIVDPWGTVIARAHDGEAIVYAEIDTAEVERTRTKMPNLLHRRPELYSA